MTRIAALRTALSGRYLRRAVAVAIVVGSILNAINQGDALLTGAPLDPAKLALTFLVPSSRLSARGRR